MFQNNAIKAKASSGNLGVKYCTFFVRNEGLATMYFEVQVTINKVQIDGIKTKHLGQVSQFLAKYEVYDLNAALDIFETHGHNVIEFGMFGSPVTSKFDGSIH